MPIWTFFLSNEDWPLISVRNFQEYFDRRTEESNLLNLTKATVTNIQVAGMGDRVCVDLCSLMKPGEGLLVCIYIHFLFEGSSSIGWSRHFYKPENFFRLDLLLEDYFLFTQNVWSQITLQADLFGWMR